MPNGVENKRNTKRYVNRLSAFKEHVMKVGTVILLRFKEGK